MKGGKKSLEQFSGYTLTDDTGTEEQMASLDFSAAFRVLKFLYENSFIDSWLGESPYWLLSGFCPKILEDGSWDIHRWWGTTLNCISCNLICLNYLLGY